MEKENISVRSGARRAIKVGCPRCEQNMRYITHVVVQRMLRHAEGELYFHIEERCRTPNDGSVISIECELCGYIIYSRS